MMPMPYEDPYVDPYIMPPMVTPPGSMGTPLGGAASPQPNIPRNNWEKLAAALLIAGALRGGKPRPIHSLAAGYLRGMGGRRQQAQGEWREDEAQRQAEAQRQRAFLLSQQAMQKRTVAEQQWELETERREQERKQAEARGLQDELSRILGNLPSGMEGIGTIAQLGARGINLAAGPQGRLMGPEPLTPEQQAKETAIRALEAKGDPTSMALATAARLGWNPPSSVQEMGAGLPVEEAMRADIDYRTFQRTSGERMLPLEMEAERALAGQRRASAASSYRSAAGAPKEETARTLGLRLSALRMDRQRIIAQLEGGVVMIEDEMGVKHPERYDKVRDSATRAELQADLNFINGEIAKETGREPLAPALRGQATPGPGLRLQPGAMIDESKLPAEQRKRVEDARAAAIDEQTIVDEYIKKFRRPPPLRRS